MIHRTFALGVAAAFLGLGALAAAQANGPDQGTIQPQRTFTTERAIRDSTRRFVPQINTTPTFRPDSPENDRPWIVPPAQQTNTGITLGEALRYSRVAQRSAFPGIGATGWTPPDPHLGVGPNHIVQVVNSSIAFFTKAGVKTFQQPMSGASGWFGTVGATDFVFDPKAFYDPISQRYFVLALELINPGTSKLLIGVSDDNNPDGTWYKYRVEAMTTIGTNNYWMDYPSYGCNKDALVVCGNMFAMSGSSGWGGVQFVVMKKAPMLTGAATTVSSISDTDSGSGQVAQSTDATIDRVYAMTVRSTGQMRVYALTGLTATPQLQFIGADIPNFVPLQRDAISTNGRTFWTVDSRLFNVIYRGGKLYTTHHVSVSAGDDRNSIRWYQFNANNWPGSGQPPTIQMAGNIVGTSGADLFFPAINANAGGDVSVIFGRSSTAITADVLVASRKASDPAGTMGAPVLLASSINPNYGGAGSNRWGDYFSTQVDPTDDRTFWGNAMISDASGNWQTTINSWTVTSLIESAQAYDAETCEMYQGQSSQGTVVDVRTLDGNAFVVQSMFVQNAGSQAAIEMTFTVDQPANRALYMGMKVRSATGTRTTGVLWFWNWTTNRYDVIKQNPVKTTYGNPVTYSTQANLTRYIGPGGQVKAVYRSVTNPRLSTLYPLNVDLAQLLVAWRP